MSPLIIGLMWLATLIALPLSVKFYRRAKLTRGYSILILVTTIIGALLLLPLTIAYLGFLAGIAAVGLFVAINLAGGTWNTIIRRWTNRKVTRWLDRKLDADPELREKFQRNPLLRFYMKLLD